MLGVELDRRMPPLEGAAGDSSFSFTNALFVAFDDSDTGKWNDYTDNHESVRNANDFEINCRVKRHYDTANFRLSAAIGTRKMLADHQSGELRPTELQKSVPIV